MLAAFAPESKPLSSFVDAALAAARQTVDRASFSEELQQLLKTTRVLFDSTQSGGIVVPQSLSFQSKQPLSSLVDFAQRQASARGRVNALSSCVAREALSLPGWAALHRVIGDASMVRLLLGYLVFCEIGTERWLQIAGRHLSDAVVRQLGCSSKFPSPKPIPQLAGTTKVSRRKRRCRGAEDRPPQEAVPIRMMHGSLIPRDRIFFAPHFTAQGGLPAGHILNKHAPSPRGARFVAEWIMGPTIFGSPGSFAREKLDGGHPTTDKLRASSKSSVAGPLLEPLRRLIEANQRLDYMTLLASHCPSNRALDAIAAFERRTSTRDDAVAVRCAADGIVGDGCGALGALRKSTCRSPVLGRVCMCGQMHKQTVLEAACSGGEAELRFMRGFPVLSCAVEQRRVKAFLVAVLQQLLGHVAAEHLFGSQRNWRKVLQAAESLVALHRGESISLREALSGMSRRDFRKVVCRHRGLWPTGHGAENTDDHLEELLARLVFFVLAHLVVPILRAHFYATNAEPTGARTVFFRKNVWYLITSRADCGYMHLCLSTSPPAAQKPVTRQRGQKRKFEATPQVRWVPKKLGLRPIVNLSRRTDRQVQSDMLKALGHLRAAHPEVLGRSLLSQAEVHRPLYQAFSALNADPEEGAAEASLHVAVADLANCYERIDHASLFKQIDALPFAPEYWIQRVTVRNLAPSHRLEPRRLRAGTVRRSDVAVVDDEGGLLTLLESPQRCPASLRPGSALLFPGPRHRVIRSDLLVAVRTVISGYRVALRTQRGLHRRASREVRALQLARGIPQGLRLSPFFCGLHMAAGDVVAGTALPPACVGFLLRLVDDFLLVSRAPAAAEVMLNTLALQQNPYGGVLNVSKCQASFTLTGSVALSAKSSRSTIPWAGLTITPQGGLLNVSAQGMRAGGSIDDTMAVRGRVRNTVASPPAWREAVGSKLHQFLDLKLTPLLLDSSLSTPQCILANVARVCGLCGLRLLWLVLRRRPRLEFPPGAVPAVALELARHAARRVRKIHGGVLSQCVDIEVHSLESFRSTMRSRRRHPLVTRAYQTLSEAKARRLNSLGAARGSATRSGTRVEADKVQGSRKRRTCAQDRGEE